MATDEACTNAESILSRLARVEQRLAELFDQQGDFGASTTNRLLQLENAIGVTAPPQPEKPLIMPNHGKLPGHF